MKNILYTFDDRPSSKITFNSIKCNLSKKYNLISASTQEDQDINLNPLYYKKCDTYKKNINNKSFPLINNNKLLELIDYIKYLNPDLIISDNEYIIPYIGNLLDIKVISISFLNILEHYSPNLGHYFYSKFIKKHLLNLSKFKFVNFDKKLIYSNFYFYNFFDQYPISWISAFDSNVEFSSEDICAFINKRNDLKNICSKFSNIKVVNENTFLGKSNIFISTGDNQFISNIIKNNYYAQINVIPSFQDIESLICALLIRELNLGLDLGQADVNLEYCLERINNISEQNKYYYLELALQAKDSKISFKRNLITDIPEPLFDLSTKNINKPNLLSFLKENYE